MRVRARLKLLCRVAVQVKVDLPQGTRSASGDAYMEPRGLAAAALGLTRLESPVRQLRCAQLGRITSGVHTETYRDMH